MYTIISLDYSPINQTETNEVMKVFYSLMNDQVLIYYSRKNGTL